MPNTPSNPRARRTTRSAMPEATRNGWQPPGEYAPPARQHAQVPVRRMPPQAARQPPQRVPKKRLVWPIPVIFGCFALLLVMGWFVQQQYTRYQSFLSVAQAVDRETFYPGIQMDGVALDEMTLVQAQVTFTQLSQQTASTFALEVTDGQRVWGITADQLPVSFTAGALLERAYALGRSGNLQQRYATVRQLAQEGLSLSSDMSFDSSQVGQLIEIISDALDSPVQDAGMTGFDPNTKSFVFGEPQAGYSVDREKLEQDILSALAQHNFEDPILVSGSVISPSGDPAVLASQYGLIASYTTKTTNDSNRNTNIRLSCEAINGSRVMPGETFSFNDTTGARSPDKGYLEAGAISGGQLIDDFGGGVCQTSSTLFNAVVRANLPIAERNKHSWPSSYVPRGEDAAVDYPRLDFKFTNDQDTPVFIIAWYADRTVTIEIYGKRLPTGVSIDLVSDTIKVLEPSNEIVYTQNTNLTPGASKETKQKRTGYVVDTYKVFFQDGQAQAKEKLWTTTYNAQQKEIQYN